MKGKFFICCLLSVVCCFFHSCKEVGPTINLKNNQNSVSDTTYVESPVAIPELKVVMIEEFTGVKCPNCPQGHQLLASIKAANPGRVVSVGFHPQNSLGYPYSISTDTFNNDNAHALFQYLGERGFEPVASVDRVEYSSTSVLFDRTAWNTHTINELALVPPVNLLLDKNYNAGTRELTIAVELHYTQDVTEQNKLTLLLSESDIISAQLDGGDVDTFYVHKDVERSFVSAILGDPIAQPTDAGRVIRKVYKTTLAAKWKPENMHIVAYVHEFQTSKIVYQGKEISVQ